MDVRLHVQSVSITTKVVISNPVDGEVYSIQHYVIKFTGRLFSSDTPVVSTNKADIDDITEILKKVALNTLHQTNQTRVKKIDKCYTMELD
jgi:hypothetical protein